MRVSDCSVFSQLFQHTAARRRLAIHVSWLMTNRMFQHTAARRRLGTAKPYRQRLRQVSTHSRPKAAGVILLSHRLNQSCFNTQPPEGGWVVVAQAVAV